MNVSSELFEAYLKCPTKCWLRSVGEPHSGNRYAEWIKSQKEQYRGTQVGRLLSEYPKERRAISPSLDNLKTRRWDLAANVVVQAETKVGVLEPGIHALGRVPAKDRPRRAQLIPIRFIPTNRIGKDDKLLVAFEAFALSEFLKYEVSLGKIIRDDNPVVQKVKTSALFGQVKEHIEKITALLSSNSPPDLVLNRHCAECEFQSRCRKKAVEQDDLSLLAGMSAKERQELRAKGIFTVTQLSYTFRPRRRARRLRDKREKYHHSLKALAIRENKIHIVGSPELKIEGTPVYWDVEGLPDRDFYYLIGMRIRSGESVTQKNLWADATEDEPVIWRKFLAILETIEKPVLVHFGRYEKTFLKTMRRRHGGPRDGSIAKKAIDTPINLLASALFAQIYFPTYSNGLKETAAWLGFKWTAANAGGAQAIIWREQWEVSREEQIKTELINYNAQDCEALEMLADATKRFTSSQAHQINGNGQDQAVFADTLFRPQALFGRFASPIVELEQINKAARWHYQRDRVYVRSSEQIRKAQGRQKLERKLPRPNKVVTVENPGRCPKCRRQTKHWPVSTSVLHDVRFSPGGIKRWIVQYKYRRSGCDFCHLYFGRPDDFRPHSKYGRNLVALIAYQVVGLCMPQRTVVESLNRLLGFGMSQCTVNNLKASVARSYSATKDQILRHLLDGNLIQADETRISVKGKAGYVWVLASLDAVLYLHTESREGERIQEMLSEFKGVLVSDFYAVYDSIPCPQQKCLVHLLRDLNDEVLNAPFDEGVKNLVTAFSQLLKPMIETVDRHGLKRHFLRKHQRSVDRFYRGLTGTDEQSEATARIKQRFEKNRGKLFTFINYDGVPWNNNNAEHAIKAFARLRRVIEGLSTAKGMQEYLTLLSVCQTCKYAGVDFLDFLRSGAQDIHAFAEGQHGRKRHLAPANPPPLA